MINIEGKSKEELFEALPEILQEVAIENDFDLVLTKSVDEYVERTGAERQIVVNFDWTEIALPKEEYWKLEYQEGSEGTGADSDEAQRVQSEDGGGSQ